MPLVCAAWRKDGHKLSVHAACGHKKMHSAHGSFHKVSPEQALENAKDLIARCAANRGIKVVYLIGIFRFHDLLLNIKKKLTPPLLAKSREVTQ